MTTFQIPPLWNNIFCALLTVLYVKVILNVGTLIRIRLRCAEESRKFVHICAGSFVLFWPLFDVTHWSWRLNILVPTVMSIKLFYKGAVLADPNDVEVQTMSRSSSPSELLYGPLQFTLLMMWVGVSKFMSTEGALIMAALGIGDGIAPVIGKYYGRIRFRLPMSTEKSLEGSIFGVFFGTIGAAYMFLHVLGLPLLSFKQIASIGLIATAAEASAPRNFDNIFLPMVIHFSIKKMPALIE